MNNEQLLYRPAVVEEHFAEALPHVMLQSLLYKPLTFAEIRQNLADKAFDMPTAREGGHALFAEMRDAISAAFDENGIDHLWQVDHDPDQTANRLRRYGLTVLSTIKDLSDLPSPKEHYLNSISNPPQAQTKAETATDKAASQQEVPPKAMQTGAKVLAVDVAAPEEDHDKSIAVLWGLFGYDSNVTLSEREFGDRLKDAGVPMAMAQAFIGAALAAGELEAYVVGGEVRYRLDSPTQEFNLGIESAEDEAARIDFEERLRQAETVFGYFLAARGPGRNYMTNKRLVHESREDGSMGPEELAATLRQLVDTGFLLEELPGKHSKGKRYLLSGPVVAAIKSEDTALVQSLLQQAVSRKA